MVDPRALVYVAIANGQRKRISGTVEFFLTRAEFDEYMGYTRLVHGSLRSATAGGRSRVWAAFDRTFLESQFRAHFNSHPYLPRPGIHVRG